MNDLGLCLKVVSHVNHYVTFAINFSETVRDIIIIIIIIIIINEKINVAFSPKTTRTRNIPKNEKTTCSVDREKQAVEQRSEPSVRHCEQVRL